jgi:hypothetical protein
MLSQRQSLVTAAVITGGFPRLLLKRGSQRHQKLLRKKGMSDKLIKVGKNNPPITRKGRPKGSPNKSTALLKDAILQAAEAAGDKEGIVGYLVEQANKNPVAFMGLMGKVLPLQVIADVTQRVAVVTDEIMTPDEWEKQWSDPMTH